MNRGEQIRAEPRPDAPAHPVARWRHGHHDSGAASRGGRLPRQGIYQSSARFAAQQRCAQSVAAAHHRRDSHRSYLEAGADIVEDKYLQRQRHLHGRLRTREPRRRSQFRRRAGSPPRGRRLRRRAPGSPLFRRRIPRAHFTHRIGFAGCFESCCARRNLRPVARNLYHAGPGPRRGRRGPCCSSKRFSIRSMPRPPSSPSRNISRPPEIACQSSLRSPSSIAADARFPAKPSRPFGFPSRTCRCSPSG